MPVVTETTEKRQLIIDLGAHEAPTAWRWRVVQFLRYEDGTDAAPPRHTEVEASAEEVATHIGAAVIAQARDVEGDRAELAILRAKLAKAKTALDAVIAADAGWDEAVRAKVTEALS